MWDGFKIFGTIVGGLVAIMVIVFILELFGLGLFKFFEPKRENVRREIYEETQSYTHGKIQELAKIKREYDALDDPLAQSAMRQIIIDRFAEFDETKIKAGGLRTFLVRQRGY